MPIIDYLKLNKNFCIKAFVMLGLFSLFITGSFAMPSLKAKANQVDLFQNMSFGCAADSFYDCPVQSQVVAGPWVLNTWQDYHTQWLNNFKSPENNGKIPYIYAYIIAGMARNDWGTQDCNVSETNNLCQNGASYLQSHVDQIDQAYQNMAYRIRENWGVDKPVLIHMEPDYFQYLSNSQSTPESGCGNSWQSKLWQYMNRWVVGIKTILPNAKMVMDISPWNNDLSGWSAGFEGFDYAGVTGKRFAADGIIDGKSYAQLSQMTGKKLIVNGAYGVGGAMNSFDYSWTPRQTLTDRWHDGVVVVMQSQDQKDYYNELIRTYSVDKIW
ncbi:MAG: hypothetical protein OHK0017_12390 [Patescibacteria group bacterium]